jgi:hypothetical protein
MKREKSLQLTLASAGGDAAIVKRSVEAMRTLATDMQTCIASVKDSLDEPLKAKFLTADAAIVKTLAGLKDLDNEGDSSETIELLLGTINTAQLTMASLTETAKAATAELKTAKDQIPTEAQKLVDSKITSGELIPKEKVDAKITDATAAAVTQARQEFTDSAKRTGERRQILTAAKLVVPGDDILGKKDEEFAPLKAQAEKRAGELKAFGLPEDRVLTLCWVADEKSYADSIALMQSVTKRSAGANGFINRDMSGKATPKSLGMF